MKSQTLNFWDVDLYQNLNVFLTKFTSYMWQKSNIQSWFGKEFYMVKLMIVMYFHYICNIPSKKRYLLHSHKDPHVFDDLFVFCFYQHWSIWKKLSRFWSTLNPTFFFFAILSFTSKFSSLATLELVLLWLLYTEFHLKIFFSSSTQIDHTTTSLQWVSPQSFLL